MRPGSDKPMWDSSNVCVCVWLWSKTYVLENSKIYVLSFNATSTKFLPSLKKLHSDIRLFCYTPWSK